MRLTVDHFTMRVEERQEEVVWFATAWAYIEVILHRTGEVVPVEGLLVNVVRSYNTRSILGIISSSALRCFRNIRVTHFIVSLKTSSDLSIIVGVAMTLR